MIGFNLPTRDLDASAEELLSLMGRIESLQDDQPDADDEGALEDFATVAEGYADDLDRIVSDLRDAARDLRAVAARATDAAEEIVDREQDEADSCPVHRHNYCDC